MGATGGQNNAQMMQQQAQAQAQQVAQQNQANALYKQQLQSENDAFSNYMKSSQSTENQSLAQNPFSGSGVNLGVTSPVSGAFLSTSTSRNTFLGG